MGDAFIPHPQTGGYGLRTDVVRIGDPLVGHPFKVRRREPFRSAARRGQMAPDAAQSVRVGGGLLKKSQTKSQRSQTQATASDS